MKGAQPRDPGSGTTPALAVTDPVTVLPGMTAKRAKALAKVGVETVGDLLRLAPRRFEDRRHPTPIRALQDGEVALVLGRVVGSRAWRARGGLTCLEARVDDGTGVVEARWWQRGYLPHALPEGRRVALYGIPKAKGSSHTLTAPALERLPDEDGDVGHPGAGRLVPVHPATTGVTPPIIRRALWHALERLPPLDDPLAPVADAEALPSLDAALRILHFPNDEADAGRARERLAFDELLVHCLQLVRRRARHRAYGAPVCASSAAVRERIEARLPFTLTEGQDEAVRDILADLARPSPMNRLLQGDVGSGKTAVAFYVALAAVAAGHQVALLAPTEVLARQHARTMEAWLEGSRVDIALLVGGTKTKARAQATEGLATGTLDIVIGTHALLQRELTFASLGLLIVDEQHKFGVRQRQLLLGERVEARQRPHCLVMTATPIPRTLALTLYGDLDVSIIAGRPPGRQPVETWVRGPEDGAEIMTRVREALAREEQVFVIYPLVDGKGKLALRDAEAGVSRWRRALPGVEVGLLHGKMKAETKREAMTAFREGATRVLVSTVVIEVGVDVPNATILVVEHAERFGLSQLHQLRGRIGRGDRGGLCVLVDRSTKETPARLQVLAETDDGFRIAEEDLKLRGGGDAVGTRQHGMPDLRAARLPGDMPLLVRARRRAEAILDEDPELRAPAHGALRAWVERMEARGGDVV